MPLSHQTRNRPTQLEKQISTAEWSALQFYRPALSHMPFIFPLIIHLLIRVLYLSAPQLPIYSCFEFSVCSYLSPMTELHKSSSSGSREFYERVCLSAGGLFSPCLCRASQGLLVADVRLMVSYFLIAFNVSPWSHCSSRTLDLLSTCRPLKKYYGNWQRGACFVIKGTVLSNINVLKNMHWIGLT